MFRQRGSRLLFISKMSDFIKGRSSASTDPEGAGAAGSGLASKIPPSVKYWTPGGSGAKSKEEEEEQRRLWEKFAELDSRRRQAQRAPPQQQQKQQQQQQQQQDQRAARRAPAESETQATGKSPQAAGCRNNLPDEDVPAPLPLSASGAEIGGRQRGIGEGYVGPDMGDDLSVAQHRARISQLRQARLNAGDKIGVANGGVDPLAEYHARLALVNRLTRSKAKEDIKQGTVEGQELFDELTEMLKKGPLPRARGLKMSLCTTMQAAFTRLGDKKQGLEWACKLDNDKLRLEDLMDWENQERRYFGQSETEATPSQRWSSSERMKTKASLDKLMFDSMRTSPEAGHMVLGSMMDKGYIGPRWT